MVSDGLHFTCESLLVNEHFAFQISFLFPALKDFNRFVCDWLPNTNAVVVGRTENLLGVTAVPDFSYDSHPLVELAVFRFKEFGALNLQGLVLGTCAELSTDRILTDSHHWTCMFLVDARGLHFLLQLTHVERLGPPVIICNCKYLRVTRVKVNFIWLWLQNNFSCRVFIHSDVI